MREAIAKVFPCLTYFISVLEAAATFAVSTGQLAASAAVAANDKEQSEKYQLLVVVAVDAGLGQWAKPQPEIRADM